MDSYLTDGVCGVYQAGDYCYVVLAGNAVKDAGYVQDQINNGEMRDTTWTNDEGEEITAREKSLVSCSQRRYNSFGDKLYPFGIYLKPFGVGKVLAQNFIEKISKSS